MTRSLARQVGTTPIHLSAPDLLSARDLPSPRQGERLPLSVAVPLILALSAAAWLGLFHLAQLAVTWLG